jgi:hypothetical protein
MFTEAITRVSKAFYNYISLRVAVRPTFKQAHLVKDFKIPENLSSYFQF